MYIVPYFQSFTPRDDKGSTRFFLNSETLAQFRLSAICCATSSQFVGTSPQEHRLSNSWNVSSGLLHYGKIALLALVLLYSLLAGLRTVTDPDTGWQLASGRYILQHHQIPSTDVLSYTARGREWIYPPLAEIVLYGLYALGGFAALSWLSSLGCAATVSCAFYAESSLAAIALRLLLCRELPIARRRAPTCSARYYSRRCWRCYGGTSAAGMPRYGWFR